MATQTMSEHTSDASGVNRRTVLGGLAGLGAIGLWTGISSATEDYAPTALTASGIDSYHPGHPLFVEVGEKLWNSAWVSEELIGGRDNLAPSVPEATANPENYDTEDFTWSIVEAPDGSDAEITYQSSLLEDEPRYNEGRDNVAEFEADEPGHYVLALEDPAGDSHELTVYAFPESGPSAGPPRIELEGGYENGEFVIETNAQLAPGSQATRDDLEVVFLGRRP